MFIVADEVDFFNNFSLKMTKNQDIPERMSWLEGTVNYRLAMQSLPLEGRWLEEPEG